MTNHLTPREALQVLGLSPGARPDAVKRAYRRLAREHHPDLGGDPDTFHRLQRAFERLAAGAGGTPAPTVSRGTPSRPNVTFGEPPEPVDLGSVDWEATAPAGETRLDRDGAVVWLAGDGSGAALRPLLATSRAPGSRLNGLAGKLAAELTSRLAITAGTDDRGGAVVSVELTASNRRARRALDRVALDGGWTRTRRSSSTQLRSVLAPSADLRATAVRATDRASAMLDRLDWPLRCWTLIAHRTASRGA